MIYFLDSGSLIMAPWSSRAAVIPWTVLLLISSRVEISLIRNPLPALDMALRMRNAFFTMGAWYFLVIVHHNEF